MQMSIHNQVRRSLQAIEQSMRDLALWQAAPPDHEAFSSTEPFCIDSMSAEAWLQWVFLPRMYALLDAEAPLPTRFAITPYFEEALKDREPSSLPLLVLLQQLDLMLNKELQFAGGAQIFAARQCRVLARMPGRRADGVFRLG